MRYIFLGISVLFIVLMLNQVGHASSTSYPITNIDRNGVVTVTDLKSKQIFQFRVADSKLLRSLKVGQLVYPDFPNQKVSLDGHNLCCTMVTMPRPASPIEGDKSSNRLERMPLTPDVTRPGPLRQPMPPPAPGTIPPR